MEGDKEANLLDEKIEVNGKLHLSVRHPTRRAHDMREDVDLRHTLSALH